MQHGTLRNAEQTIKFIAYTIWAHLCHILSSIAESFVPSRCKVKALNICRTKNIAVKWCYECCVL